MIEAAIIPPPEPPRTTIFLVFIEHPSAPLQYLLRSRHQGRPYELSVLYGNASISSLSFIEQPKHLFRIIYFLFARGVILVYCIYLFRMEYKLALKPQFPCLHHMSFEAFQIVHIDMNRAYRDWETDRKSTRLNSSHSAKSRMPSSA